MVLWFGKHSPARKFSRIEPRWKDSNKASEPGSEASLESFRLSWTLLYQALMQEECTVRNFPTASWANPLEEVPWTVSNYWVSPIGSNQLTTGKCGRRERAKVGRPWRETMKFGAELAVRILRTNFSRRHKGSSKSIHDSQLKNLLRLKIFPSCTRMNALHVHCTPIKRTPTFPPAYSTKTALNFID